MNYAMFACSLTYFALSLNGEQFDVAALWTTTMFYWAYQAACDAAEASEE